MNEVSSLGDVEWCACVCVCVCVWVRDGDARKSVGEWRDEAGEVGVGGAELGGGCVEIVD